MVEKVSREGGWTSIGVPLGVYQKLKKAEVRNPEEPRLLLHSLWYKHPPLPWCTRSCKSLMAIVWVCSLDHKCGFCAQARRSRNPHITLMKASVLIRLYLAIAAFTSCLEEDMLTLVWDLFQEVIGKWVRFPIWINGSWPEHRRE